MGIGSLLGTVFNATGKGIVKATGTVAKATGKGINATGMAATGYALGAAKDTKDRIASSVSKVIRAPRNLARAGTRSILSQAGISPILDALKDDTSSFRRRSSGRGENKTAILSKNSNDKLDELITLMTRVANNTDKTATTSSAMNTNIKTLAATAASQAATSVPSGAGTPSGPSGVAGVTRALGVAGIAALAGIVASAAFGKGGAEKGKGTGDAASGDKNVLPGQEKFNKFMNTIWPDFLTGITNLVTIITGFQLAKGAVNLGRSIGRTPTTPTTPRPPTPPTPPTTPRPPTPPTTPRPTYGSNQVGSLPEKIRQKYVEAAKAAGKNVNLGSFVSKDLLKTVTDNRSVLSRTAAVIGNAARNVGNFAKTAGGLAGGLAKGLLSDPSTVVAGGAAIQEARARKYLSKEELTGLKKEYESGMESARLEGGMN